jgi:hypothetical protein
MYSYMKMEKQTLLKLFKNGESKGHTYVVLQFGSSPH